MPMTPTGFVPYSASQELTNIQNVFKSTFGNGVNLLPTSINGIMIQELTNQGLQVESDKTLLYSQLYNPDTAPDVWLDGLCKWNNIQRLPAQPSIVTCQVTGIAGVVIPINSSILNADGDVFKNPIAITIGLDGTATGVFQSEVTGAIPCGIGTLTRIVQQLSGWDTVNNSAPGVLGQAKQSDYSLRNERKYELAINSTGSITALVSQLDQTVSVKQSYVAENNTNAAVTIGGVIVSPKSIYVSVYGTFTNDEIGAILFSKKSAGCGMDGNTTGTINPLPEYPWVTFNYTFQTATPEPVQINIDIVNLPIYQNITDTQIKQAILANFQGEALDLAPVQIGTPIYAARFIPSLTALGILEVISLTIQLVSGGIIDPIDLSIDKVATLDIANILIVRT